MIEKCRNFRFGAALGVAATSLAAVPTVQAQPALADGSELSNGRDPPASESQHPSLTPLPGGWENFMDAAQCDGPCIVPLGPEGTLATSGRRVGTGAAGVAAGETAVIRSMPSGAGMGAVTSFPVGGANLTCDLNVRLLTFKRTQHRPFMQGIGFVDRAEIASLANLKFPS